MNVENITSPQNGRIRQLAKLLSRKGREEAGRFLVEGVHLVEEALRSEAEVLTIVYDRDRGLPAEVKRALKNRKGRQEPHLIETVSAVLQKLCETQHPQGIVAEVSMVRRDWHAWWTSVQRDDLMLLLLDEIQDPGNAGTILRTAEAAGADAVVLGRGCVDVYNGKVIRATMGAVFRLPVFACDLLHVGEQVQRSGGRLLAATLGENSRPYDDPVYDGCIGIVIGNEGRGVSKEVVELAAERIHIPLYGKTESLNAAVAAGVILYEARRQRKPAGC